MDEFRCECGQTFQAERKSASYQGRCPACDRVVTIPGAAGGGRTARRTPARPASGRPDRAARRPARPAKNSALPIVAGVGAGVIALAVVVLLLLPGDPEARDRDRALAANTAEACEEFLTTYPASADAGQVLSRLEDLLRAAAEAAPGEESCRRYLGRFPEGRYAAAIRARLEQLVYDGASRRAADLGDAEPLRLFLAEFPGGANAAAAQSALMELEYEGAKAAAEAEGSERPLLAFVDRYPGSPHAARVLETVEDRWIRNLLLEEAPSPREIEAYLARFPEGRHAETARKLLRVAETIASQADFRKEHAEALKAIAAYEPVDMFERVSRFLGPNRQPDGALLSAALSSEVIRITEKLADEKGGSEAEKLRGVLRAVGEQLDLPDLAVNMAEHLEDALVMLKIDDRQPLMVQRCVKTVRVEGYRLLAWASLRHLEPEEAVRYWDRAEAASEEFTR